MITDDIGLGNTYNEDNHENDKSVDDDYINSYDKKDNNNINDINIGRSNYKISDDYNNYHHYHCYCNHYHYKQVVVIMIKAKRLKISMLLLLMFIRMMTMVRIKMMIMMVIIDLKIFFL